MDKSQINKYLTAKGDDQIKLFEKAQNVKEKNFGKNVWFRGLIEFSNICKNNCLYCGIRKENTAIIRFKLSLNEILECLKFIDKGNYGSVAFQSGELISKEYENYLFKIVKETHKKYPHLGITLSCGEQSYEFYEKLREAGAMRYLLRIETSNKNFYKKLHPNDMSWDTRFECLKNLQKLDYHVGTGIMVGLPDQTLDILIQDLKFFIDNKFDMFGIGPYVIHNNTPLGKKPEIETWWHKNKEKNFNLFLNFLAVLRILLPKVNIAAATACDVFDPQGRIKVLQICGNVMMPSVTPKDYRDKYLLYENKPNIDDQADKTWDSILKQLKKAGLTPALGEQGNSPFYYERKSIE
jgi:biotin synthase